jgi:hypothetical protein
MSQLPPIINGHMYNGNEIEVTILGRRVVAISAINYTRNAPTNSVRGRGKEHIGYTPGDVSYEGNITLYQEELIELQRAALAAGFSNIDEIPPVNITCKAFKGNGTQFSIDIIENVKFQSNGRDFSGSDASMHQISLWIGTIRFGAVQS